MQLISCSFFSFSPSFSFVSSQCQSISRCCDEVEKRMNSCREREGEGMAGVKKEKNIWDGEGKGKEGISEQRRSSATSAIEERDEGDGSI